MNNVMKTKSGSVWFTKFTTLHILAILGVTEDPEVAFEAKGEVIHRGTLSEGMLVVFQHRASGIVAKNAAGEIVAVLQGSDYIVLQKASLRTALAWAIASFITKLSPGCQELDQIPNLDAFEAKFEGELADPANHTQEYFFEVWMPALQNDLAGAIPGTGLAGALWRTVTGHAGWPYAC